MKLLKNFHFSKNYFWEKNIIIKLFYKLFHKIIFTIIKHFIKMCGTMNVWVLQWCAFFLFLCLCTRLVVEIMLRFSTSVSWSTGKWIYSFLWAFEVHIFITLDIYPISHVTIFLFCCKSKTNHYRCMKTWLNVYIFIFY